MPAVRLEWAPGTLLAGHDAPCPSWGALLWASQPGRRPRSLHRWRPVLSKAGLFLVVAAFVALFVGAAATAIFVGRAIDLRWFESVALAVLAVTLFGRKLPKMARWLGYRPARGR